MEDIIEQIGIEKESETDAYITYTGKENKSARIFFDIIHKSVIFEGFNTLRYIEIKLIEIKMKELGWNNE